MKSIVLIATTVLLCSSTWADPAAWYKWHSPLTDYDICAQFSPGDGWVVVRGPFEDSGCRKPLKG